MTTCSQLAFAASLEEPPERCDAEAVPGLGVCEKHAYNEPDPDHLRDLMIDRQMEEQ